MTRDFWDIVMQVPSEIQENELVQIKEIYLSEGRDYIFSEAKKRKVLPFVAHALIAGKIDVEFWRGVHENFIVRNRKVIQILEKIFNAFKENACSSPCVTENFGALLSSGTCLGCFCSGDVDISADISECSRIIETLESLGLKSVTRKEYHAKIKQEEFKCPEDWLSDFYINIVWLPVIREKAYTINQSKMIQWLKAERLNGVYYRNTSIKLLKNEAMLIHCIYHLSVGHYYCASPGIRLLTEVDRIIRYCTLNWEEIELESKQLEIEKRVYTALYLTQETLGTPMPEIIENKFKKNKTVTALVHKMYIIQDNKYVLKEPDGLKQRLYVDVMSDPGNMIFALIKKITYAMVCIVRGEE